jgi:L-seryl-tRNA(Ser) seleniumtransferase
VGVSSQTELLRQLPSVDEVLRSPEISALAGSGGAAAVTEATRAVLANLRGEILEGNLDGNGVELALSGIAGAIENQLAGALRYSLQPVINATGVILHTNLGRAPLGEAVFEHIRETARGYSNLEFDLESGERGKRDGHVDKLLGQLFSKELGDPSTPLRAGSHVRAAQAVSTIVVNNNAAAVLLALNTLAENGEVVVSRGELVEIGGSFRIPDVMGKSQATLREVGTTNRTRTADYEKAINEKTRLILRVHRSNFEISGFTEQPGLEELAELSRKHKIPLMEDLGSGALFDLRTIGVSGEPSVFESLRAGVDVVSYSGDKLLGGPQAGLLSGRADFIARMRSNSLFRALRVDKLTYAALEATLLSYVKGQHGGIPALRMMHLSKEDIGIRAEKMAAQILPAKLAIEAEVIDGASLIGGGAAPSATLPTRLIAITHQDLSADEFMKRLRESSPPVVARVEDGRVLLDLRTVFPEQDEVVVGVLRSIAE